MIYVVESFHDASVAENNLQILNLGQGRIFAVFLYEDMKIEKNESQNMVRFLHAVTCTYDVRHEDI